MNELSKAAAALGAIGGKSTSPAKQQASRANGRKHVGKPKTVKLHHYGHPRALFDTRACREGFKADRAAGLIYGPYWLESENRYAMNAEEASAILHFCPYCNAKEGQPV